jgi:hypothetical protein
MTNCMTTAPAVEVFRVSFLGQGSPSGAAPLSGGTRGASGGAARVPRVPWTRDTPCTRVDATLPAKRAAQKSITLRSLDSGIGRHSAD